jgi:hypothetical protein
MHQVSCLATVRVIGGITMPSMPTAVGELGRQADARAASPGRVHGVQHRSAAETGSTEPRRVTPSWKRSSRLLGYASSENRLRACALTAAPPNVRCTCWTLHASGFAPGHLSATVQHQDGARNVGPKGAASPGRS